MKSFALLMVTMFWIICISSKAYSYDIPSHREIVVEASKVWLDTPQEIKDHLVQKKGNLSCFVAYDFGDDILTGSIEEDREDNVILCVGFGTFSEHTDTNEGRNGFLEHFWDPDFPADGPTGIERRGYNCGSDTTYNLGLLDIFMPIKPSCGDHFDSAYRLAQDLWDNKVIPFYRQRRIGESYYWLGRVAHLLSDMAVPAHVQLRPHDPLISSKDFYEDFVNRGVVRRIARRINLRGREYQFECLPNLPCDFDWERIHGGSTNLFRLFWYTAQKTQYWTGMNKKGLASYGNDFYATLDGNFEPFKPTLWNGEAIPFQDPIQLMGRRRNVNLRAMADALVPHALKAVAGLYRLFWMETHPEVGPVVFEGLGVNFFPNGFSADGSVIVGCLHSGTECHAAHWTAANGLELLKELPGATSSSATAVSADGLVIVGLVTHPHHEAFRWTEATGMIGLGDLPGGIDHSLASGVSADGSVVVGVGHSGIVEAFRWTQTEGMNGLGTLGGFPASEAFNVSADGSVVIGYSFSGSNREAFRWTSTTETMIPLGDLPGGAFDSIARKISADGSVVVGDSVVDFGWSVFRWTESGGMENLGNLAGGFQTETAGVSADGTLIVGRDTFCCPGFTEVFIWNSLNGMRKLRDVLTNELGLDLTGWTLNQVAGISPDGRIIVGSGINPLGQGEVWMVKNFVP